MKTGILLATIASLALVSACGERGEEAAEEMTAAPERAADEAFPATTSSEAALAHYESGWEAWDVLRFNAAHELFLQAAVEDRTFAMAHLMAALSAPSTEGFSTNLANALDQAENATEAEQLLIRAYQKGFEGDQAGQIDTIRDVLEITPNAARIWSLLGFTLATLNDTEGSRAALAKAMELDPTSVYACIQLGNNYLFQEPVDYDKADKYVSMAVGLAPDEPVPHDYLGDVHRAQNDLEAAYEDYTRAAELAPDLGAPLQQRGHVNSFLGKYEEARSDYTRSAELEDARGTNLGPFFLVYRAYVNVHEGYPESAIEELVDLADAVDAREMQGVADLKANALSSAALVAIHYRMGDEAQTVIERLAEVLRAQAADVGTDAFRDAQEATIAYWQGLLAARMGDSESALAKAAEFEQHVASSNNPRKLERMHEILGHSAYQQGAFDQAVEHLANGDLVNNMYTKYYLALAHDSAGNAEDAERLFKELAVWNFNGPGYALTRGDVLARLSSA